MFHHLCHLCLFFVATHATRVVLEPSGYNTLGWYDDELIPTADAPDQSPPMEFIVRLKENKHGMERVRQIATDVSNPLHSKYGQYVTRGQITAMTAPSSTHIESLQRWVQTTHNACALQQETTIVYKVTCNDVPAAEALLQTSIRQLRHVDTQQVVLRAGNYVIPDAIFTVFGLHGIPTPPKPTPPSSPVASLSPTTPRNVTPSVILKTYNADHHIKIAPNTTNTQAVVSFSTQLMNAKDLVQFFQTYVPDSTPGIDDTVSKFVGDPGTGAIGTSEATLDIQYMMGVATGVPTEFWKFAHPVSFCGQLHNFTTTLLDSKAPPLVTSVSYGWQSDLSAMGCVETDIAAVENDFIKIAARGLTVVVASGDWGSGSGGGQAGLCRLASNNIVATFFTGEIDRPPFPTNGPNDCCTYATGSAFSYEGADPNLQCILHPGMADQTLFNGTVLVSVPVPYQPSVNPAAFCCIEFSIMGAKYPLAGWNYIPTQNVSSAASSASGSPGSPGNCVLLTSITGNYTSKIAGVSNGGPLPGGSCTIFKSVNGSKVQKNATSRSNSELPLWASWPAVSPWVTSVGSTKFIHDEDHNDDTQMATSQFGSGGGFSSFSSQTNDTGYEWQRAAVDAYVQHIPLLSPFPPKSAYNSTARATPDVSSLGEGYQIIMNGKTMTIGGTSAAAPAFAGLISLLNEKKLQQGEPTLGFLNPWLYGLSKQCKDGLTDVLAGTNAIDLHGVAEKYGWNATEGWDAATGLGTPNVSALMDC